jgi:hypothetical protein
VDWSEAGIGTHAISEAMVTGQPMQLFSGPSYLATAFPQLTRLRPATMYSTFRNTENDHSCLIRQRLEQGVLGIRVKEK